MYRLINGIFTIVETHMDEGDLITEYKMSALPSLYEHFVELMKCLVNNHDILSQFCYCNSWFL